MEIKYEKTVELDIDGMGVEVLNTIDGMIQNYLDDPDDYENLSQDTLSNIYLEFAGFIAAHALDMKS